MKSSIFFHTVNLLKMRYFRLDIFKMSSYTLYLIVHHASRLICYDVHPDIRSTTETDAVQYDSYDDTVSPHNILCT